MKFSVITSTFNQLPLIKKAALEWDKQSINNFEWIIADDGSTDGTTEWIAEERKISRIKYVRQENKGYDLVGILNKAGKVAEGEFIVWVMADSTPKEDFLERLGKFADQSLLLNGMRLQIDEEGKIVEVDWRLNRVKHDMTQPLVKVAYSKPWELMTLNTMCMPRKAYEQMGGIYPAYQGYGQMDWDMVAWCHYHKIELAWVPTAVVYHLKHEEKKDTEANVAIFQNRLNGFINSSASTK